MLFRKALKSIPFLIVAAAAGAVLAAFSLSAGSYRVAGTTVEARVFPAGRGTTVLKLPPLGEIEAGTHLPPVGISVSLEKVSVSQVKLLTDSGFSQESLLRRAENDLVVLVRRFIVRLLLLGVAGGLLAALILPGRNVKRAFLAAAVGIVVVALPTVAIARHYRFEAWRQPRYSGMLTAAPWLIDTVEEKLDDFDVFRDEMRRLANNVYTFYAKVDNWEAVDLGSGKLRVLHVGDIHNNPVAFDIMREIVRDFQVDIVVDTGDLTDLGTPMESGPAKKIGALGVPYVFVPGNHDSPSVLEALRRNDNVVIADDRVVKVEGVRILGLNEPAAEVMSAEPTDAARMASLSRDAARRYRTLSSEPLLTAAHSIKRAEGLVGETPVLLVGHTHRPSLMIHNGTVIADVGTSGAAGIRNFEVDDDLPYSFKLLHFDRRSRQLKAVDSLAIAGASRDFFLERRLIGPGDNRLPKWSRSDNLDLSWQSNP